jgi:hypothetical protein
MVKAPESIKTLIIIAARGKESIGINNLVECLNSTDLV